MTGAALSDQDREILLFERGWSGKPGHKAAAVLRAFGLRSIPYYQALNGLLRSPAALAVDPLTVGRLRRQRDDLLRRAGRYRHSADDG